MSDRAERTFVLLRYLEETAPVKLPTIHGPRPGLRAKVRTPNIPGWYFVGSTELAPGFKASHLSYTEIQSSV